MASLRRRWVPQRNGSSASPSTFSGPTTSLHAAPSRRCSRGFRSAGTWSVCLTELMLKTLGDVPQHVITLVDPANIVLEIHHPYRRSEWRRAHYPGFQTWPSSTADIEGVLLHGAQGSLGNTTKASRSKMFVTGICGRVLVRHGLQFRSTLLKFRFTRHLSVNKAGLKSGFTEAAPLVYYFQLHEQCRGRGWHCHPAVIDVSAAAILTDAESLLRHGKASCRRAHSRYQFTPVCRVLILQPVGRYALRMQ